jgi:hypothetical protein
VHRGLIFGLIRLRSPKFTCVRINAETQVADVNGIRRTVIPSPENRKVGGSTPPLATKLLMQQRSWQDQPPQYPHFSRDSLAAHQCSHPAAERVEVDRAAEVSVASVISIHTDRYANATMGDVTV